MTSSDLTTAIRLLEAALYLRQNGERAPGGNETWAHWERRTEAFLRTDGAGSGAHPSVAIRGARMAGSGSAACAARRMASACLMGRMAGADCQQATMATGMRSGEAGTCGLNGVARIPVRSATSAARMAANIDEYRPNP